jgi:hypothetical protein
MRMLVEEDEEERQRRGGCDGGYEVRSPPLSSSSDVFQPPAPAIPFTSPFTSS